MLLAGAGRRLPGWRGDVAAAVSPAPVQEGLRRAAGMPKEPGRDAGEESRTNVHSAYAGECWKVN